MLRRDAKRGFAMGMSKRHAYEFNEASDALARAWNVNDPEQLARALKRYEVRTPSARSSCFLIALATSQVAVRQAFGRLTTRTLNTNR